MTKFKYIATTLATSLLLMNSASASENTFTYAGDTGPNFWSETTGWEACAGTADSARQSPINIENVVRNRDLEALELHTFDIDVDLINNGHTIEQEYENGSSVLANGIEYELLQFHFHTFSEHAIRGKQAEMELHAVFKDPTSGNLAVIGKLFKIGEENDFLETLIDAGLPEKGGDASEAPEEINVADVLGNTSQYFTYPGSLTTPACSEIVTWYVLKRKTTMSEEQYAAFRDILGNNFRPLQDLNGRTVESSTRRKHR